MASYTEQDPLLPGDKRSPEIHGSRAQSINDDYAKETLGEERPGRSVWNDLGAMLLGICIVFSLAMIFLPSDTGEDERPVPRTIDERVNRILEDTPLIGQTLQLLPTGAFFNIRQMVTMILQFSSGSYSRTKSMTRISPNHLKRVAC